MGQYNKAIITSAGKQLIAQAVAGKIQLNITKAKTSDHHYPEGTDFKVLKDMQGIKQTMILPETKVFGDYLIQTKVLFSNEGIQAAYCIRNIGLYAMNESDEVLFCIVTAKTPDEMPQYDGVASTSYIYNIQNTVQDAKEIHISVNASGTATIQDIQNLYNYYTRINHTTVVTLPASEWGGSQAPFTQTVDVQGATADLEPILVSALEDGATVADQKAYNKAFGIVCSGTAFLGDGTATFRVYKKPTIDVVVGLKGV